MDKKTVGIIATVATFLFCACPSFFLCLWGVIGVSGVPINQSFGGVTTSEPMPMALGVGLLCLSLIGILTPVAVGFFTLRKKPEDAAINAEPITSAEDTDPFPNDDPLPPPS